MRGKSALFAFFSQGQEHRFLPSLMLRCRTESGDRARLVMDALILYRKRFGQRGQGTPNESAALPQLPTQNINVSPVVMVLAEEAPALPDSVDRADKRDCWGSSRPSVDRWGMVSGSSLIRSLCCGWPHVGARRILAMPG